MIGRRTRQPERFLATILFTDIVGSTDAAAELGDREWRRLIAAHHDAIRRQLRAFGGREIDTAGDGFFASFDQPAQAVRAADAMLSRVAPLGLALRAGVHTGECERIGGKLGGIAVHTASRVMSAAAPSEVLVSSTVRDLVAGSGLEFVDRGLHALKGLPTEVHLYSLVREAPEAVAARERGLSTSTTGVDGERPRRRMPVIALGGALVLVGIAVGVVALALARPPSTAAIRAGPDTIVSIDTQSGKIVDVRRTPTGPVALAVSGDGLWVAALDDGLVTDMALTNDGQDRPTGRVGRPTALAVGGGFAWVADAFDQNVTLVDVSSAIVRRTIDDVMARDIIYASGSAWATDDIFDRVIRLDQQRGEIAQSIDLPAGTYPGKLAYDGAGSLWVVSVGTSTLIRIDPTTASVTQSGIALRAAPDAIAASATDVWVAVRAADELLRIDRTSNSVRATIEVCDQPAALAIDGDTVWVACAGSRDVRHYTFDGSDPTTIDVGGVPTDIAVVDNRVFVTVRRS